MSQRNIAAEVGCDQKTVSNVLSEEKRNGSEIPHHTAGADLDDDTPAPEHLERPRDCAAVWGESADRQ